MSATIDVFTIKSNLWPIKYCLGFGKLSILFWWYFLHVKRKIIVHSQNKTKILRKKWSFYFFFKTHATTKKVRNILFFSGNRTQCDHSVSFVPRIFKNRTVMGSTINRWIITSAEIWTARASEKKLYILEHDNNNWSRLLSVPFFYSTSAAVWHKN